MKRAYQYHRKANDCLCVGVVGWLIAAVVGYGFAGCALAFAGCITVPFVVYVALDDEV